MSLTEQVKRKALELGFDLVGVAPFEPVPELNFYKEWIEAGYAGKMGYLERNADKRCVPHNLEPEAKSVIVCAAVYHTRQPLSTEIREPRRGWISRYAWGDDYHDVLKARLDRLVDFLAEASAEPVRTRVYVDTGPILERVYARYAGIGWFGKNTCIINQQKGSWLFLAEVVTSLELAYDAPPPDRCGTCNRCLEACPTGAILEPYVLDARRCISYLTIELRDAIPVALRPLMGNHVFGCDICQDVCPWNRKAPTTDDPAFQPRPGLVAPDLRELAELSEETFRARFRKSPVKRSKYAGFLRNVAVALGNTRDPEVLPTLERLARHENPLVAEHAQWAVAEIQRVCDYDFSYEGEEWNSTLAE